MKKTIYLLAFLTISFINAQTKESDYFTIYKGGEKYLKPLKYILFDEVRNSEFEKKENKNKIYFNTEGESFIFDIKKHKKDTCSIDILKKLTLENTTNLKNEACKFFKKKKEEVEKKKNITLIYPPAGCQYCFKVYILEKIGNNKLIKYEVEWAHSNL
ncbi:MULTISPECIES: hypothetical protein [Flavobacterium]|uniref:Uncharacterized protein n=1 Tax=Flavobacterium ginsengisoli TaxID=871694 RepID=A0ABP7F4G3_9FLAO|nr:hypothetical protein [Flavobacterium sp. IB48]MBJ2125897.1 hypothetical protein [Flavobacterium sp. IB48]